MQTFCPSSQLLGPKNALHELATTCRARVHERRRHICEFTSRSFLFLSAPRRGRNGGWAARKAARADWRWNATDDGLGGLGDSAPEERGSKLVGMRSLQQVIEFREWAIRLHERGVQPFPQLWIRKPQDSHSQVSCSPLTLTPPHLTSPHLTSHLTSHLT